MQLLTGRKSASRVAFSPFHSLPAGERAKECTNLRPVLRVGEWPDASSKWPPVQRATGHLQWHSSGAGTAPVARIARNKSPFRHDFFPPPSPPPVSLAAKEPQQIAKRDLLSSSNSGCSNSAPRPSGQDQLGKTNWPRPTCQDRARLSRGPARVGARESHFQTFVRQEANLFQF